MTWLSLHSFMSSFIGSRNLPEFRCSPDACQVLGTSFWNTPAILSKEKTCTLTWWSCGKFTHK